MVSQEVKLVMEEGGLALVQGCNDAGVQIMPESAILTATPDTVFRLDGVVAWILERCGL